MGKPQVARRTSDFEYVLPPELIAQYPTKQRGESRLLVVGRRRTAGRREAGRLVAGRLDGWTAANQPAAGGRGDSTAREVSSYQPSSRPATSFRDLRFSDFPTLLLPGDLLVLNSTRVRHARLLGRRGSGGGRGGPVEVLLLHPTADDSWVAMGKPGSALLPGKRVELGDGIGIEILEVLEEGYRRVRVTGSSAEQAMARMGRLPLPPYINREPTSEDEVRYQTVFAQREGSVAAPTAGLHFTPGLLLELERQGVRVARLDLEVDPGTFQPVDEEDYTRHRMHPERYEIPETAAVAVREARERGSSVWAVGSTVVRALESAANPDGTVRSGASETRLMIAPGYRFRVVDRLLSNFHLPRSTLLMLVAAFAGYDVTLAAYRHAIAERYRFYSYGDAMAVTGDQ